MPYGFKPTSCIYQTAYARILRGLKNCDCYIDDEDYMVDVAFDPFRHP